MFTPGSLVEYLPEPESFITSTGDNGLSVGAHGEIENTECMASQRHNLLHARILPNHNLVLAVSVGADDFVRVLRPGQIAHLAARADFFNH